MESNWVQLLVCQHTLPVKMFDAATDPLFCILTVLGYRLHCNVTWKLSLQHWSSRTKTIQLTWQCPEDKSKQVLVQSPHQFILRIWSLNVPPLQLGHLPDLGVLGEFTRSNSLKSPQRSTNKSTNSITPATASPFEAAPWLFAAGAWGLDTCARFTGPLLVKHTGLLFVVVTYHPLQLRHDVAI